MSMESDLSTLLKTICPRVYPDLAPVGTVTPYVTWQAIGGTAIRFGDGSAPDKRNTLMQINVWSKTRLEALTMIRSGEHTSELQSHHDLVCRLLLEKKKR